MKITKSTSNEYRISYTIVINEEYFSAIIDKIGNEWFWYIFFLTLERPQEFLADSEEGFTDITDAITDMMSYLYNI